MEKSKNKPKLRFPGFTESWEQRKLNEKVDIIGTGKSKFISNIQETEGKPYAVLGSTSVISYDNEYDYSGDFVLTARVGANAGDLYQYSGNVKISDNTVFLQGKNLNFVFYLLTKFNLKNLSFGTGQPLIKASELSNLDLMFPCQVEENKQIGAFFKNLDNLITLHQRKLNHLKDKKKSLLQKMFPKKGEDSPELRFPGFTDPWEQCKAQDIFATIADKNHPDLPVLSASQEYGMIKRDDTDINIHHDKGNEITYKRVLPGQFVIHLRSFQGGFAHSNVEGITSPAYTVIDFIEKENHYDYFWKYIFNSKVFIKRLETVTYGIRDGRSISYNDFSAMTFIYPKCEEQKAIGEFFIKLDNLITLHQRKLNHLQELKKALLQQMFV